MKRLFESYNQQPYELKLDDTCLSSKSIDEALQEFYDHIRERFWADFINLLPFVQRDFKDAFANTGSSLNLNDELCLTWLFPTLPPLHASSCDAVEELRICNPSLLHKAAVYAIPVNQAVFGDFNFYRNNPAHIQAQGEGVGVKSGLGSFRVALADTLYDAREIASLYVDRTSDSSMPLRPQQPVSRNKEGKVNEIHIHIDASGFTPFRSLRRNIGSSDGRPEGAVARKLTGHPLLRDGFLRYGISELCLSRQLPTVLRDKLPNSAIETLLQADLLHFSHKHTIDHPFDAEGEDVVRISKELQWAAMDVDVASFIDNGSATLQKLGLLDVVRLRNSEAEYLERLGQFHHAWDWTHAIDLASEMASGPRRIRQNAQVFEVHRKLTLLLEQTLIPKILSDIADGHIALSPNKRPHASSLIAEFFKNNILTDRESSVLFWQTWLTSAAKSGIVLDLSMLIKSIMRHAIKRIPEAAVIDRHFRGRCWCVRQENNFVRGVTNHSEMARKAVLVLASKILLELRNFFVHGREEISEESAIIENDEYWHSCKRLETPERPGEFAEDAPCRWAVRFAKSRGVNVHQDYPKGVEVLASRLRLTPDSATMIERIYLLVMIGALA